jgi:PST family polysaccharide transporter/lipopolysaccharide exporter
VFRARTAENVAVFVGLQWFNRGLGVATKLVLVRLLAPQVFGVFALAAGLIGFIGTFGSFGLDYAIIQKGDRASQADYDVGLSLRLVIAVGLFAASVAAAGPWASLFSLPSVAGATQVLALVYLAGPFSFVPATRLSSELRYRAIAIPSLLGQAANASTAIALALLGFGIWSLVYGLVMAQIVSTLAYTAVRPWKFRLSFHRPVALSLFAYARHIVSASLLLFLITNLDNFAVGYFLGTKELGLYVMAYVIGYLPVTLLSSPAGSALFPSLVKVQSQGDALRRGYLESFGYAAVFIAPAAFAMASMAPEVVRIFLGPKWIGSTVPLIILSFYGMSRALVDFSSSLFGAVGKPRIIAVLSLYTLVGSLILLFPLTLNFGISGTAVAMTIPVAAVASVSIVQSARVLRADLRLFLQRLRSPLIAATIMAGSLVLLRIGLYATVPSQVTVPFIARGDTAAALVLAVMAPVALAIYLAVLWVLDPSAFRGLWRYARMILRPRPA